MNNAITEKTHASDIVFSKPKSLGTVTTTTKLMKYTVKACLPRISNGTSTKGLLLCHPYNLKVTDKT